MAGLLANPHMTAVTSWFKQTIWPEHLVAYLLHPKCHGLSLTTDQRKKDDAWLLEWDSTFMASLISHQAKTGPFPASFFTGHAVKMNPITWWKAVQKYGINADFVATSFHLLSAPASSGSTERIFNNFSNIHTKVRNKLGIEKGSKFIFCYIILCSIEDYFLWILKNYLKICLLLIIWKIYVGINLN